MAEYTGKGLAAQMPKDDGRAMGRLSDFILQAETLKYNTFKENEKEFLKTSNIDPAFFISTANQKAQSKLLDEFNKKWAGKWKDTGYKMSSEDKMQMQAEKNFVIAQQQDMLSKQRMWEEENALVKKNPGDFDEKEHALKTAKYIQTGEFDYNSLPYRAQSVANDLMQYRGKIGQTTSVTAPLEGNPDFQVTTETIGTRDEIAPFIIDRVFSNPRIKKDMMQKWSDLPQSEKDKYLDIDESGDVSEEERRMGNAPTKDKENPILKFYIDQNYQYGVKTDPGKPQRIKSGAKTSFDWNSGVGSGNNRNTQFSKNSDIQIQQLPKYKTFYDLQLGSVPSVIQKVQDFIDSNTGERKTLNQAVNMKIVGYSPETDRLIVNVEDDVRPAKGSKVFLMKDTKIEIDASLYDALLKSKPYGFSREKAMAEIGGKETTQTETPAERMNRLKGGK